MRKGYSSSLLYKLIKNLNIPLALQIQLFNHIIIPILQYGSEICGFQNTIILENVQIQILRSIAKLRKSTPHYIVNAELGVLPLRIHKKSRIIGF